jgi:two-component system, NtrC family, sensor kinase
MTDDIALLVIDDDPEFLSMSGIYLEEIGFRSISTARSSQEALDILGNRSFDVIVADYELPPGMNSIGLLKTLKARGDDTPFIILTGRSREEVAIEALNSGAAYYLQKGIGIEILFAELRNMIVHLAEKRRAKEMVERQEIELRSKNQELESFCYSISHDLRAPLRVIDGYCAVIMSSAGKDLPPEMEKYLQGIQNASGKMNLMIKSLLEFSRAGRVALNCRDVDLSTVARDIAESLKEQQPGRDAAIDIEDGIVVYGDHTLLSMALQNLMDNAWKYTGKTSHTRIAIRMTGDAGARTISISDNGAGFDAAEAENLFRPFTRYHTESEFPGTGIGLATVHRIIERHGGRLRAESRRGNGATFSFTLPDCRNRAGGEFSAMDPLPHR